MSLPDLYLPQPGDHNWAIPLNESLEQLYGLAQGVIDSSVVAQDPVVAGLVNDRESASFAALNAWRGYVSVKDFGAVGDGVTDDYPAFLAAYNASNNVYVPGTDAEYLISQPLMIRRSGFRLFGDGVKSKITIPATANAGQLIGVTGERPTVSGGDPTYVENVTIDNVHVNTKNGTNLNGLGVQFARNCVFSRIWASEIGRKAVTMQYFCQNNKVSDVHVISSATEQGSTFAAISLEGTVAGITWSSGVVSVNEDGWDMVGNTIERVTVDLTGYNGVTVSNCREVSIRDIKVANFASSSGSLLVLARTVANCVFDNIAGGNVRRRLIYTDPTGNIRYNDIRNITCENCTAQSNTPIDIGGTMNRYSNISLNLDGGAQAVVLLSGSDNIAEGFELSSTTTNLAFSVSGERNTVRNSRINIPTANGINMSGTGHSVENCRLDSGYNGATYGISCFAPRARIIGNTIIGDTTLRIQLTATAVESTITGNKLTGNGSTINVNATALPTCVVFGNFGDGNNVSTI